MKNYIAEILRSNRLDRDKNGFSTLRTPSEKLKVVFFKLGISIFENISLVYICLIYYATTIFTGLFLDKKITGDLTFYYSIFSQYLFAFFFLIWSGETIIYMAKNIKKGFEGIPIIWRKLRNKYLSVDVIPQFLIIFLLIPLFICSYSSLKQTIPLINGFTFDLNLYKIDKFLHFNHTPWELLQPLIGYPAVTKFIDFCYLAWGSIFVYSLLYMACHKSRKLRLQFFISLACCWIFIGNVLANIFSSAGPCYFSRVTGLSANPYAGLFSYLESVPQLGAITNQDLLWRAYKADIFMPLGGISAMPSMHVSIAVLLALLYKNFGKWQGRLLILFAAIIQIGSVHLGWHYAVDGYLSGIVTILIWKGVAIYQDKYGKTGPEVLQEE